MKVNYLVGNKKFKINCSDAIFNKIVCDFTSDLSKNLLINKDAKKYPDIKTFAFWCRKQNIEITKKNFNSKKIHVGLGLIFHITPSNVPTNFAYSLIFGLLSGNSNIIKVPSKKFIQIKIICNSINQILNKKKYFDLKKKITIVRYSENNEFTKKISSICNARIIWGGNKTISEIRQFPLNIRSREIAFSDRFSLSVIRAKEIIKLNKQSLYNLIEKFYNDTYLVDQNACSSPHLIIWVDDKNLKARRVFWNKLHEIIKKKYVLPSIASIEKYTKLCLDLVNFKNIKSYKSYSKLLYIITLKNIFFNINQLRGKWGYFYELNINNLNDIAKQIDNSCQTLTYFGFDKSELMNFVNKNNLKGIDRIVPIGQGLNMNVYWDGYDITNSLSRIIDLK